MLLQAYVRHEIVPRILILNEDKEQKPLRTNLATCYEPPRAFKRQDQFQAKQTEAMNISSTL